MVLLLLLVSCGTQLSTQEKVNRISFLNKHGKSEEAIAFVQEAYQEEEGEARGRILMEGAATAFGMYTKSLQKSNLVQMFGFLNIVINEGLPQAPDAFLLASQAYQHMGNLDKAIDYAKKAADVAPSPKEAGRYYKEVIDIYYREKNYEQVIVECDRLEKKYPDYDGMDRIDATRRTAKDFLAKMSDY